jgi:hypothetical protein
MSERCKWLHEVLEGLPLVKFPFEIDSLPNNGIYFFYERGEFWGHGERKLRIIRVGTHKGNNFKSRISEHFLINESKMNFKSNRPKPSDRSIFRKNIGRALLNKNSDPYLSIWEIDFTTVEKRMKFGDLRNIEKERLIEKEVTKIIREKFCFRFIIIDDEKLRIGSEGLESLIIGTLAKCQQCKPSPLWLGNFSPKSQIRSSGLWVVQHLKSPELDYLEMKNIEELVKKTEGWIEGRVY